MRIVFFGSGEFSRDLLSNLILNGLELEVIVTRPDRPAGRGRREQPTPVRAFLASSSLLVLQPESPSEKWFTQKLRELNPDLLLVADYGHVLQQALLELPQRGCINIHPSLLPSYRGPAPIQRALMDGLEKTGVTMMLMDEGVDTGPIVSQAEMRIGENDDAGTLREKLAVLASRLVMNKLPAYLSGQIVPRSQEKTGVSYADPIGASDMVIDWTRDNSFLHNQVRALSPRPGAYTFLRGKRIKILRTRIDDAHDDLEAGKITVAGEGALIAGTGQGALYLETLQPEGKKILNAAEFLRGYRLQAGEGFTTAPP